MREVNATFRSASNPYCSYTLPTNASLHGKPHLELAEFGRATTSLFSRIHDTYFQSYLPRSSPFLLCRFPDGSVLTLDILPGQALLVSQPEVSPQVEIDSRATVDSWYSSESFANIFPTPTELFAIGFTSEAKLVPLVVW